MDQVAEEHVHHQILVREVNERVRESFDRSGLDLWADGRSRLEFLCECSNDSCMTPVSLTPSEYERARAVPSVFIVLPGHETPAEERILLENERFFFVEKMIGGELAAEADPRGEGPAV
jgi:hypothetical protein